MNGRALRVGRLLLLAGQLTRAWERAYLADDWDEAERLQVRSRAVSAALVEAVRG